MELACREARKAASDEGGIAAATIECCHWRVRMSSSSAGDPPRPSKNKEETMEEKTRTITCRLDEPDFQKLKSEAAAMDLNTSDYIRLLTRLPIKCKIGEDSDSFVVIDPRAQGIMDYQIRKQGILLNQAAHALNTITLKIRNGAKLDNEMLALMKKANKSIDEIRCRLADLKLDSEALVESRKLYLDIYRRKPKR